MKEESRLSYAVWLIFETLVRILISIGIIFLLYFYIKGLVFYAVVALFAWWILSPIFNGMKKKKRK